MRVEINPVSRIEGHAKVTIFLDASGRVERAFFQATELRGYEKILVGIPMEEVPRVVSTICGICRAIHFVAALKACDQVFGVEASEAAELIREMLVCAHFIEDHTVSLLALALPDYVSPEDRTVLGVIRKLGGLGREILRKRSYAVKILQVLGGRNIHPVASMPGGWSRKIADEEMGLIERYSRELLDLGLKMVDVIERFISSEAGCELKLASMATVDKRGYVNLYDGHQVVISWDGREIERFTGKDYLEVIAERVVPWSYSKVAYLRKMGWRGMEDGENSSLYMVGPSARLRIGKLTPVAEDALDRFSEYPRSDIVFNHIARAVEIVYAAERLMELSRQDVSGRIQNEPERIEGEGVGIVEAPRGTLIHHYRTDERGIVRDANLVVATTQNVGAISVAVRKVAERYAGDRRRLMEGIEMAIRTFDPCMACSTHALNGKIPVEVEIYSDGEQLEVLRNHEEDSGWSG